MRKQFRIVLLIMACLWCWVGALAVPANPNPHVVTQPDGTTIRVRLCGDEYYHYYTTEDGTPVTLCDDGFYRYTTIDAQNNLVASADVVGKVNTLVLPDKKSVLKRHSELYKVNKAKKVVDLPRKQAPMRSAVRNAGSKDGVVKGIIVLAEFQDQKFTFSQKAINDKMNKVGYTDEYGSIGSVRDYFIAQSYGKFQPEFDVVGPVTLSQNMAYYGANYDGGNDIRPHEMVAEACQLASQQGLADMSDYDHDGDGWVDLVYVIYAGYPESSGAPGETIWPHAWYVYSGGGLLVTLDGVSLNAYACSAELNGNSGLNLDGIGTFCHEYSHTLGLPDFYDIDYSGAMGMSWWSIMAHGNYGVNGYVPIGYNAYEREFCGWLEFNELTDNASIRMPELTTDNAAAYKITSTNANQYVTIETRCKKGWDVSLPSEGMMVIAVDYNKEAWDRNGPNDDPNRQRFKLIPADDDWNESNLFGDLYPYGGNTTLSSSSSPKLRVHNTTINGKSITGIAYNNGVTTFDFKKDDVPGDEPGDDLSYLEGTYSAFAKSAFKDYPDEEWQVNITVDKTDKGKVWIQPVCMFGGLDADDISPIYATYNATDNTLVMPSGQVVYEDSDNQMVIAKTRTGSDINLTDNFVMQIEKNDYGVDISFANDCYLGVGDILNDNWWSQALYYVSYSKISSGGDDVPAELEGVYNAFANSAFKDYPDEEWQVNITIDNTEKGKVWIQPVCMFGGLDAVDISPIYATYNAADNTLNMPLGQVVFENSQYKMVIAQTTGGSDKNLTGNIVMQINNNANGVDISFANDCYLGVGDILNDDWWYQALQNISYSKTTIVDEPDEVPAELEGVYNAFANSGYQGEADEEWQVNITIDNTEKGKVWIQPVCMFGGLDAEYISPIYATYNAADNTLNMPLGQVVYEDSEHKLVIAQTVDGSDKNSTGNIVMQIDNNANGVEITFAEDYLLGVGDILNDNWWYQALYNISYSKTTIVDEADEVPAELEGVYNAFANSGYQGEADEEWQVNITIDETEKGKVWIQPVCMFSGLDAEYISPIYATYNAADNTLNMPLGQVVYEDSEHKLVIAQTVDGSDKNLTGNIVMQIDNNANGVEITFADDYLLGVGDILNDNWWYQALYNISYSKTTIVDEPDEVPAEIEGVYNAFANSGYQGEPDEEWQVNITVDKTEKGKVWIQPVCMFGGLDAEYISPIYATYNAADNTLNMPLGQVVYEDSEHKLVIAQTVDGSDKNLTGNIVMQIDNNANGVDITFAEDYLLGVGDILNDVWWYQALYNISYSKTTAGDEPDEVPAELEGVYNAFANSAFKDYPDEEWQVNITIDNTEKGKVWIQPVCMFGGLDAVDISPIYATYNAADNTLNMPLGQVVFENSQYKMVIAQTTGGSDKNLTGNIVMQIDNNANGVDISFANDCYLGVGDILNDDWWYQALQNISYSKTTIVDEPDEVPAELEGVYNAFANSGYQGEADEEWQVNITIDETERGKVWIQPVCMFGGLDAEYISPIYATYNAADNTLNMPLGQVVYEDSEHKLVIAQTVDGSDKNLTGNIVMQIDNNANGVEITFADDYLLGVGDILNDNWWYQALYNISYSKTTAGEELATSISLDKKEVSLEVAETTMLTAIVLPETATNKSVTWTSSNEAVVTVDANGVVTAIAVGEAVITATTTDGSDLSATCQVTVVPTLAVSIEVTPNSVEAEENSEVQLSVNILPENATYKSVEWSSSNDAIASVNANGLVKIRKEGNVVITATTTDGTNLSATCSINVYSGIDGVNGNDVIVATIGDNIVVKNAKLGSNVRVYAADGSIITSEIATDGDVVVEAPVKGIYVVAIDGKSFKVMVK